jgi:hypothetical protein
MKIRLLITIVILLKLTELKSQPYLLLYKDGSLRKSQYQIGDPISFKLKGDDQKKTLIIKNLMDSSIVFEGGVVGLDEISTVYIMEDFRSWSPSTYATVLFIAGTGYMGLELINDKKISKSTVVTSAALISSGVLIHLLKRKKVKLNNKYKLKILELENQTQ